MVTALTGLREGATGRVALGSNGQVSLALAVADGVGPLRSNVSVDFEPRAVLWDGVLV